MAKEQEETTVNIPRHVAFIMDGNSYYYVPTFYVGGVKAHEGAASKDIVERVLRSALE